MQLTPEVTYAALLLVQAGHLLHHRLAKRHISYAEVISAVVLCVSPSAALPGALLMGVHIALIAIQLIGSIFIRRLSPKWSIPKYG